MLLLATPISRLTLPCLGFLIFPRIHPLNPVLISGCVLQQYCAARQSHETIYIYFFAVLSRVHYNHFAFFARTSVTRRVFRYWQACNPHTCAWIASEPRFSEVTHAHTLFHDSLVASASHLGNYYVFDCCFGRNSDGVQGCRGNL